MHSLNLGYNTNGLAHHDLLEAIRLLAKIGYHGVGITIDHGALNPYDDRIDLQIDAVATLLEQQSIGCVIETGARYLLDPRVKHEPTLVTSNASERQRRIDFLCRSIDIASRLKAGCVSLWSGVVRDGAGQREVFGRLTESLAVVLDYSARRQVRLAFEPEPGMFIDTLSSYDDLIAELESRRVDTSRLGLTIDIGHLHCQGDTLIAEKLVQYQDRLANVHIEDMRFGIHEHLMFGEGEIDFPPVIAALAKIGYAGVLGVELSRHSHDGPATALRAYNFLTPLLGPAGDHREGEAPAEP
jgi:L-ribulose-5-phosphate 3-epimerase